MQKKGSWKSWYADSVGLLSYWQRGLVDRYGWWRWSPKVVVVIGAWDVVQRFWLDVLITCRVLLGSSSNVLVRPSNLSDISWSSNFTRSESLDWYLFFYSTWKARDSPLKSHSGPRGKVCISTVLSRLVICTLRGPRTVENNLVLVLLETHLIISLGVSKASGAPSPLQWVSLLHDRIVTGSPRSDASPILGILQSNFSNTPVITHTPANHCTPILCKTAYQTAGARHHSFRCTPEYDASCEAKKKKRVPILNN